MEMAIRPVVQRLERASALSCNAIFSGTLCIVHDLTDLDSVTFGWNQSVPFNAYLTLTLALNIAA